MLLSIMFSLSTAGGRIVPRFQELTPEKLGKVFFSFKFNISMDFFSLSCLPNCFITLNKNNFTRLEWCERNHLALLKIACSILSGVQIRGLSQSSFVVVCTDLHTLLAAV